MSAARFQRLKPLLREVLPPFATRAIKSMLRKSRIAVDPLAVVRQRGCASTLGNGKVLRHRDSFADRGVIEQIFVARDYDLDRFKRGPELRDLYSDLAAPLIVDCGANIGASALWFACTYPKAKILAIEPERSNFDLLTHNSLGIRVEPIHGAVADRGGTIELGDPGAGEWGFRAGTADNGNFLYSVPAYSISDLVAARPETPFILKIDIEGAEEGLFRAPVPELDLFPVIIIELHDWMLPRSASSQPFLRWHAARNRDLIFHGENAFSIANNVKIDLAKRRRQ